ncbi:MAG: aromatic ring-hydroxylating dioxygenase subunit alpha, partial [Gammaproteobacteria bacterium]|nr:aromatic ring-hydroxylating dioxygenase subunit alpha [Gammaproteobacteria bacterium]
MSTERTLKALADNANRSFTEALSLPPGSYHDRQVYDLELERVFRQDWICIGRHAEMPNPGDYIARDIVDSPVFVIRQRDGSVKAFANVCLHRAARLLDGSGHVSRISCPYHSWTYDAGGQLIGAPFMNETPGFDSSSLRLRELHCESWEGFVYVSLADSASSPGDALAGLTELVGDFRMGDYVSVFEHEESWDANWKCLVENYMDSYHIHRVHKDSFARYGSSEDITHLFPGTDAYAYHLIQEDEKRKSVYAHPENTWLKGDDRFKTYLINIFPSHVIQLQPDLLWYLSILPEGVDRLRIRWAVSIPAEILDNAPSRETAIE